MVIPSSTNLDPCMPGRAYVSCGILVGLPVQTSLVLGRYFLSFRKTIQSAVTVRLFSFPPSSTSLQFWRLPQPIHLVPVADIEHWPAWNHGYSNHLVLYQRLQMCPCLYKVFFCNIQTLYIRMIKFVCGIVPGKLPCYKVKFCMYCS